MSHVPLRASAMARVRRQAARQWLSDVLASREQIC